MCLTNHHKQETKMQLIDFIGHLTPSDQPNPEEAVNSQLEWEPERKGIANGTVCDDGFAWSDQVNLHHLFGRQA